MQSNKETAENAERAIVISYDGDGTTKLKVYLDADSLARLQRGRPAYVYAMPDGTSNAEIDDRNGCAPGFIEISPEIPPVSFR